MMATNISLTNLFESCITFIKSPFVDIDSLSNESERELILKLKLKRRLGKSVHTKNDTIRDGRIRLNLLFNEIVDRENINDEVLISSYCLDDEIYSSQTMETLKRLAQNDKVKIIYAQSSENIKSLLSISETALKRVNDESSKKLGRFIISPSAVSFEKKQKYNDGNLIGHNADFYYNLDLEIDKDLEEKINQKKKIFQITYDQ